MTFESGDCLLVVDVINDFEHEDGEQLFASFRERLPAMTETIAAARAADAPVIYVNDDRDRWDSDAPALVSEALATAHGAEIVGELAPQPGDPVILKHRYSAFDHTALDLLLERLELRRLVLVGGALEGCVVQTAIDARERGFAVSIVAAACATTDSELEAVASVYVQSVVGARLI